MKKYYRRSKGLTILDLVLALALTVTLLAIVFPFFFSNQKGLSDSEKRSRLQQEAQSAMEYLTRSAMQAAGIKELNGNLYDAVTPPAIFSSNLALRYDPYNSVLDLRDFTFRLDDSTSYKFWAEGAASEGYSLHYSETGGVTDRIICRNLYSLELSTLNNSTYGADCRGIKLKLILKEGRIEYSLSNTLYFRNSSGN